MGERTAEVLEDPTARQREGDGSLRAARVLAAGFVGAWVLALALAAAGVAAVGDLLAAQGKLVFLAGATLVLAVRAHGAHGDRTAWWLFSAAVGSYLGGAATYEFHYRGQDVVPHPSWADLGYMGFYPLAFTAFFLMLRSRVRRLTPSTGLDVVVTACTAAAVASAAGFGAQLRAASGDPLVVATGLAYPIGDLLLLSLVAAALTLIGRGAGPGWWWVTAGLTLFVTTDTVYAFQLAHGTYRVGGPLDIAWGLAFVCCGMAATQRARLGAGTRVEGRGALVLPTVCALVALALLFRGYMSGGDPLAGVLALVAVLAALGRAGLTYRDVKALADSRRQARTDELTGLPNRRSVFEALDTLDARLATGAQTAVLVLDLDRFKEINDSLGHAVGDALLRRVGPRLRSHLREGDLLARLGGDEFVVLAEDLDAEGARRLAERLRERLQRPFRFAGMGLSVDASIGIAVGPGDSASAAELLQLADLAMYSAKAGRSGVAVYDEARDGHGRHRLEDVAQLRRALEQGELVLHYQPKLALPTGAVDGVEALVRWQHPTRGLLFPDAFLELAESAGLMAQLTSRVVDMALAQCRAWADAGRQLTMAVNVSPSNLVDEQFPDQVRGLLAAHGLPASALVLEVTESLLMEDRERAVRVLSRLRDDGVGVAIDDYGTGYSSLAYLASLPVTELKLDRTFVSALTGSARAESIVTSTLQLAHALGLVLVAEGAEDQDTVDALASIGCDVVQGYHLSRPLPAAQLESWLDARSTVPAG
ncbi:bifunctional diguanylate cyclase/phosphodiesterase [Blastococcus sp. TF02A-30]|uniref:putative bifunctional diguanylate cyclase/phosphodiesterase n=1 Tax=Blastococcus sp. TF02A-30 TaxID=2250580 RepID=UPI000DE9A149|nr:EAL domain-containing protein [Blastococcus sp. TF02A-30]RBY89483.1 GGDEF-domain containing protein [Blastococcus sp. TF02A-30]